MAISGVERLVQYARDLNVEPARAPRQPEPPTDTRAKRVRAQEAPGDGIKLSLSSAATEAIPAEPSAETSKDAYDSGIRANAETSAPDGTRRGNAVSAYQRQGAAPLGQRIAIRA